MPGSPYRESAAPAPSRVRRNARLTSTWLIVAAFCSALIGAIFVYPDIGRIPAAFLSLFIALTDRGAFSGDIALGLFTACILLVSLYFALFGSGTCPCPACGVKLEDLSPFKNDAVICPGCHHFFEGTKGRIWETDPERVAKEPIFRAPLPRHAKFPEECVACGKPATRRVHVEIDWSAAGMGTAACDVPVCETCADKRVVMLVNQDGGTKSYIYFCSLPYLRKYCELNAVHPA